MSDDPKVTFRVWFLTAETTDMTYPVEEAEEIADQLDQATTILGCPDCEDLAPVTGGIPRAMPTCQYCGDALHGVTSVEVVRDDRAGGGPTDE